MADLTITRGNTLPNSSQKADFHNLIDLATGSVSNIVNADINSAAAIASSKLDLSAIAQNLVMSSKIFKAAKGADVASVAGAITLGDDGNYFDITGTNAITSITAKTAGTVVTLQFDSTASLVDGSNLKLAGNFQGAAESQITLVSDGTNWFEVSRSPTSSISAASQAEMEAGSSTTVYVTPGRTQYHPGVAKGWIKWDGEGTTSILGSYNVTSLTDEGTGDYTITWATDFADANYAIAGAGRRTSGETTGIYVSPKSTATYLAGSVRVLTEVSATPVDTEFSSVIAFGDQA